MMKPYHQKHYFQLFFSSSIKITAGILFFLLGCALFFGCGSSGGSGDSTKKSAPQDGEVTSLIPSRSSTIALTADDTRLVVVNRQNDSVSVIRVRDDSGRDVEELVAEIPVGKEPRFVAITPDDSRAFVTNAVDGTVDVIDLTGDLPQKTAASIQVGTEPRGIAVTPNGAYIYVANHTAGSVSVIAADTLEVINTIEVGGNPMAIAISNNGDTQDLDETVYVTRFFSEVIDPLNRPDGFNDAKEGKVDYFSVEESLTANTQAYELTVSPLLQSGFTADRRQFCQNTRDILQDTGEVVFFNSGVDGTGDGAAALANETFCPDSASYDAAADGPIGAVQQGVYPNHLYGALIRNNSLYIPNVGASPEPPVFFIHNVQALVSVINLANGQDQTVNLNDQIKTEAEPADPTVSLDRLFGNDVVAIDASPTGDQFLIVSRGGNYVLRATLTANGGLDINAANGAVRFQTGNIPSGVVISQDGARAYTNNEVDTSVTAIDLDYNEVLNRQIASSQPPTPGTQKHRNILGKLVFFTALGTPDDFDTNGDGRFDLEVRAIEPLKFRGKASSNAWSSCTSCHEDGHSDNVTWIFPTGPRQTIALEGTFAKDNSTDQRILNWNAVRGSVTDFNNNARGVQGGIGFATDVNGIDNTALVFNHGPTVGISDALDAMTEWVANAVRSPIMPDAADNTAYTNGRYLFETHCAVCHGGDKWTKSTISSYQNNPTFETNPLGPNFFAEGGVPSLDPNLVTAGPQIRSVDGSYASLNFLDDVGTFDAAGPLEIRGAGAIGGGVISIAGDANEGVEVTAQSTQGFGALGGIGFNTPSLLGVAFHSPYFHDGSAITLEEVFARHQLADQGGATIESVIADPAQLNDLSYFLLSIDDDTEPVPLSDY